MFGMLVAGWSRRRRRGSLDGVRPSRQSEASRRRLLAVGALLAASAFGASMVVFRVVYTGTGEYRNLVWNLFLAWIPFVLALVVYDRDRRGTRPARLLLPALVWLLFLPNAPYLVTDFKFLAEHGGMPVWYDVTMLTTFAWTGLLLGFLSLYLMHGVARRALGTVTSWIAVAAVLGLTSFGVFLGRIARWNSWDVVANPGDLAADLARALADPAAHRGTIAVTVALAGFLSLAYLALYSFLRLAQATDSS
jgi:uncharacterized membrane protein